MGPKIRAVTLLSNSPRSFDAPMNKVESANTRPCILSGVVMWIGLKRRPAIV